jgi:hypothetical protein
MVPVGHSTWLSNPMIVRKNAREISLCVESTNINIAYEKGNYPFPNMGNLLQIIIGSKMLSFFDGFSSYNQVLVNKDDMHKITFTTPWGTYEYLRIPFSLINAGATFQRAMDYAFKDIIGRIIDIYQDNLIVFSKDIKYHVDHLR